jgi:RNA polymerase sigma-70 factor (ECF subfamily)
MDRKEEFLRLFLQHEQEVRAFVNSLVHDWYARDDVFQEVAMVLWAKFDDYDRSRPFGPWARGVAANKVMQGLQKSGRAPLVFSPTTIKAICDSFDQRLQEPPAEVEALKHCIAQLPEKSRHLLELYYGFAGPRPVRAGEIASQLRVNVDAIYQALSRLRTRLRECIDRVMALGKEASHE